jgi:hypothetical protein
LRQLWLKTVHKTKKMIKILWVLVGLNIVALIAFIGAYFVLSSHAKNADGGLEQSWIGFLVGLGVLVILLAAIPLRYGHSTFSLVWSGFFATLPLVIGLVILLIYGLPSSK